MNFYNYMLTIQTETMKTAIKKGLEIRCMEDKDNKRMLIADPTGQTALSIPSRLFMIDTKHPDVKEMTTLPVIFDNAKNAMCIEPTSEIIQANPSTQLVKMHAPESGIDIWINSKFLGYFKGVKHLRYGYFEYRGNNIICAYEDTNFEVLGVTIPLKPKR